MIEMSALGGSLRKLSLPSLQKGTKRAVFMLAAMRSGRSANITVTGLTPTSVNVLLALSKVMPFEVWTKRKSASLASSAAAAAA